MDYKSFKRHLGKGGLKVGDFARLVGVSANSISNYAKKGEVPQTHALLAVCFGELGDRGLDIREMLARYGALPSDYCNDPKNPSVIQFDMFKEVSAGTRAPARRMKVSRAI
ncbi:hypothetical protein [Rhodocyclus tenuis]|uniref:hypothetical protein n=1 Tax=Rhodocyclus tenuis TaxID=1066 RepID=UPI001F5BBE5C|nr:hypothetical protein [Rhodocyclus tenuis]